MTPADRMLLEIDRQLKAKRQTNPNIKLTLNLGLITGFAVAGKTLVAHKPGEGFILVKEGASESFIATSAIVVITPKWS
ncbi:MAG: hypothetical protein DI537_14020 [Stutzerimonas stutzeri]|nr:MAG: hypothetical protein DI537_14020 [Stutzerimonas stutzeri]